ncbi:MAG: hypothetical protein KBS52_07500 [Clostridiales bacterium]|nr:hypothetical protein [Candidatus Equinaster intestinalis]
MKEIHISDITVEACAQSSNSSLTFREKIEVAKLLDRIGISVFELGKVSGEMADNLLIKSVASSVKDCTVAVCTDFAEEKIASVWSALKEAKHPRLQICAAVSTARMEYVYHKKADGMIVAIKKAVSYCKTLCDDVEFIAEDATRADFEHLCNIIKVAAESGASTVSICDTAGIMLPDEFGEFIKSLYAAVPELKNVSLGVKCSDNLGVANACAISAIKEGATEIKATSVKFDTVSLEQISQLINLKSAAIDAVCKVSNTEINRVLQSIEHLCDTSDDLKSPFENGVRQNDPDLFLTQNDTPESIVKAAESLGYELDDEDKMKVWKSFTKLAQHKDKVTLGEFEAIIASKALQVPATYILENYVVTTGNAIDILAHVKLKRDGEIFDGVSLGDGPIDAAFLAIEQITGHHYELDDFQIQAVSEGKEAAGQTIVKLRSGGKIYSGRGISTDIIGSGVEAYVNALNKILYEEENL